MIEKMELEGKREENTKREKINKKKTWKRI